MNKRRSKVDENKLRELFKKGYTYKQIGDFFGVSHWCIYKHCKRLGLKRGSGKRRGVPIEVFESEVSTEEFLEAFKQIKTLQEKCITKLDEITLDVDPDIKYIMLCFFADLHLGHLGVDYDLLKEYIKILEETENAYVVFLGDVVDADVYPNWRSYENLPEQLVWKFFESLMIRLRGKIVAVCRGNHEYRLQKLVGVDLAEIILSRLGIPYLSFGGDIRVKAGDITYLIHVIHKTRYRSVINPVHACIRLAHLRTDADIIVHAHYHEPSLAQINIRNKQRVLMTVGTFLTESDYAHSIGLTPSTQRMNFRMPCVILNCRRKEMQGYLDLELARYLLNKLND